MYTISLMRIDTISENTEIHTMGLLVNCTEQKYIIFE